MYHIRIRAPYAQWNNEARARWGLNPYVENEREYGFLEIQNPVEQQDMEDYEDEGYVSDTPSYMPLSPRWQPGWDHVVWN